MSQLKEVWSALSRKVIASPLIDHGAVFPVRDVLHHNTHWFTPKEGQIWRAICQCVDNDTPPTVEAVTARLNGDVPAGYVQAIANQWTDEDNRKVVYHAQELRRLGMLASLRSLGRELAEQEDPDKLEDAIGFAEIYLSGLIAEQTDRDGSAASVSTAAWEALERDKCHEIPTGLSWFDKLAGGLWPGTNTWVAGAYKSGKSTLMRNMVLAACEAGYAVDVFAAEGSREMFVLDCQAMIATRLLIQQGIKDKLRVSGLFLRRTWRHRDRAILTASELDAIGEARSIWERYNIRVWDTKDGITDLVTLHHRIRQSKMEYGAVAHYLDYSQLFGKGKTLFERQSNTSLEIQRIAQSEDVAICMLAQRNEDAIRGGGDGYSPGIKGGGDAAAAADFLFTTGIDEDEDGIFHVQLKLSRHVRAGRKEQHAIEPESGLIIDRWVTLERIPLNV